MPFVDTPQSVCRFGLARCDITPPSGIYHRMWGAASHDRATGVHRPLTATAMIVHPRDDSDIVDDSDGEQVLVALDHCLLWAGEMRTLADAVCSATALDRQRLVVTFSHTHAAGLMGWERERMPGGDLIRPCLDRLAEQVAETIEQARRSIQPVAAVYGYGKCDLAAHRDFWDEDAGAFVCGFNPAGAADDTVLVARFADRRGDTVATIVNYACHPTTLAWDNTLISPDYPGALREIVEEATGAPCVFLQGASGDLGPREGFVGDVEIADRNGRQLGHAVLSVLESLPPPLTRFEYAGPVVSGATIGTWKHVPLDEQALQRNARWCLRRWTLDLAYRPGLPTREATQAERERWRQAERESRAADDSVKAADCRAMVERSERWLVRLAGLSGEAFAFPIGLWQIGGAVWLTVEGEPYSQLQTQLRRRFPGMPLVVCELAGGSRCSYLPPREVYGKGIYQESVAMLDAGCLETLIDAVGGQISAWAHGQPQTRQRGA